MDQTINETRYYEIIERIKDNINSYENILENNFYSLNLANGDYINISFPRKSIPHLLGVNTDEVKALNLVHQNSNNYGIFNRLLDESITFYSFKNKNNTYNFNKLFSKHIDEKIEAFRNNITIRTDDIYCIIKYNSERNYTTGEEQENSDYFIIRNIDNKYHVLGIIKDEDKLNTYLPVTSRLYENKEELDKFLTKVAKNQEITYPTILKVENKSKFYKNTFYTKIDEKSKIINSIMKISEQYGCIPSNLKDTKIILDQLQNSNQRNYNYSSIVNTIVDNMKSGLIIDKEDIKRTLDLEELPNELEEVIRAVNDIICSKGNNKNNIESYSNIQKENEELKDELSLLKEELEKYKKQNKEMEEENNSLKQENNLYSKKLTYINDAFNYMNNIKKDTNN